MKEKIVKVQQLEVGDYVITPSGVGIVKQVMGNLSQGYYYEDYDVMVQHKSGISNNPNNEPKEMKGRYAHQITKAQYESEE
jgi:hypothetical protein